MAVTATPMVCTSSWQTQHCHSRPLHCVKHVKVASTQVFRHLVLGCLRSSAPWDPRRVSDCKTHTAEELGAPSSSASVHQSQQNGLDDVSFLLQQSPGAWVTHFVKHCQDPTLRLALFQSCRQFRDLVLQSDPDIRPVHATLHVDGSPEAREAAGQKLAARSQKQTSVTLQHKDPDHQATLHTLQCLAPAHITGLIYYGFHAYDPNQQASIMSAVTSHLPSLTSLRLFKIKCPLPPPDQLPRLAALHIGFRNLSGGTCGYTVAPDLLNSVKLYLPQLSELSITDAAVTGTVWEQLLEGGVWPLTHLATLGCLDDALLDLFLQCTPQLKVLKVKGLSQLTADRSQATWDLATLYCSDEDLTLPQLDLMPQSTLGVTQLEKKANSNHCLQIELSPSSSLQDVLSRLSRWQIKGRWPVQVSCLQFPEDPTLHALQDALLLLAGPPTNIRSFRVTTRRTLAALRGAAELLRWAEEQQLDVCLDPPV